MSEKRRRRQGPEEEYHQLFQALVRAIMSSKELGPLLEDLMSKGLFGPSDLLVITLRAPRRKGSVGLSLGHMRDEEEGDNEEELPQYIDGEELSPLEKAFEEYCAVQFDEARWLKENRLTLRSPRAKPRRTPRSRSEEPKP